MELSLKDNELKHLKMNQYINGNNNDKNRVKNNDNRIQNTNKRPNNTNKIQKYNMLN
jgi:hypothetical protein